MVYLIEGNIGVGKSSIIKELSTKFKCIEEPVNEWTFLEDFYKDPTTFGTLLQYQIMYSYFKIFKNIKFSSDKIFLERSHWSAKNVFQYLQQPQNYSSITDFLYNKIVSISNIDTIFYIDLDVDTCLERIKKRNRNQEHVIDKNYLKKIENRYKELINENSKFKIFIISSKNKTPKEISNEIISLI